MALNFGPYVLLENIVIVDYLSERRTTKTLEDDVDDAYSWVQDAVSKYEDNVHKFARVMANRLGFDLHMVGQERLKFEPENIKLQNIDKSFRSLHYKIKVRDLTNHKAVVWLEFLNDKVKVRPSFDKKVLGDMWTNNSMDGANFAVTQLEKFM